MLKRLFKYAGIGFLIGVLVGNLIAFLTSGVFSGFDSLTSGQLLKMTGGNAVTAILLQSLFSGLYGALCFGGMLIYEAERLPLAAATALHCAMIILSFIPIGLTLGWVGSFAEVLIMASIQFVVYFIIWLIISAIYKKQVRELNDMQKDFSKHHEDES